MDNSNDNRKEWLFTFIGGGWNTVWAETREEAVALAAAAYPHLPADPGSFKPVEENQAVYKSLLAAFW